MDKKMSTPVEILCKNSPPECATYLNYCRALRFEDRPDYAYLKRMFKDLFFRENYQYDFIFDWTVLNFTGNARQATTSAAPAAAEERPAEAEAAPVEEEKKSSNAVTP